jgi:hypothetical protein
VNGLIDDAMISATAMNRLIGEYLERNDPVKLNKLQNENTNVLLKLSEARNIQSEK